MFHRTVAPGIELKLLETGEAKTLYALADRNRARLREWLPWVDQTRSPEDVRLFILSVQEQYRSNHGPQAGVWVDGVLSGTLGCHPIDWTNRNCSVGYWLDSAQEGKGVITRCCAALTITFSTNSACTGSKSAAAPETCAVALFRAAWDSRGKAFRGAPSG